MPRCSCLALAGLSLLLATPGQAADGAAGAISTGSIMIRVSVAPRAWTASPDTLCVTAPRDGYSLRLAETGERLAATAGIGTCSIRAQALTLPPSLQGSGGTLLIVAE
jgi:hypothetical protein